MTKEEEKQLEQDVVIAVKALTLILEQVTSGETFDKAKKLVFEVYGYELNEIFERVERMHDKGYLSE